MNKLLPQGWLRPDWPVPAHVHAVTTTRSGGVSQAAYASLNLGAHVGDDPLAVTENRRRLRTAACLPSEPLWLNQVHGNNVAVLAASSEQGIEADASITCKPNVVCAVLTADCLPLLVCNRRGTCVAAVHAGWRGLAGGIIEASLSAMQTSPDELFVWMGPAIGPKAFEIGDEVREILLNMDAGAEEAFVPGTSGHWLADLYMLARRRMKRYGIEAIYGGNWCTLKERDRFYSYRRDGVTGRMASLVWFQAG